MDHMIIKNNDINYHYTCANVKCNASCDHIVIYNSQIDAWDDGWFLTDDPLICETNYGGNLVYNNELWACPECAKYYR